jgi:cell division protein FtsL
MVDKLKLFYNGLISQLKDIWNRSKVFIIAIGAAVIYLEWNRIKEAFQVYMGQKELNSTNKKDQSLETQENNANAQANSLIQAAQNLPSKEKPVTDDWNKS